MPAPIGDDVAAYLGRDDDMSVVNLAYEQLPLVTAFVRAYTGGRGFDPVTGEPVADVGAVIVTATARLVTNPTGLVTETIDDYSVRYGPTFNGWTLPELAVLHRYRRRTA